MKKQGWKETGGIGKTLQGRSEPVKECFFIFEEVIVWSNRSFDPCPTYFEYIKITKKVKYKFDGYGIGHDQAEHHKFKWWERAFETAAASIEVGDGKLLIFSCFGTELIWFLDNKIQKTGKGGPVVSTTMPISKALNKAMLYGRFIKRVRKMT